MQFQVIILCLHTWVAIQGTGGRVPINNWSGGVNGIVFPKFVVFVSTLSRLFCVCDCSCWGNLQPFSNPLARFKWAARWGGKGNAEKGKRKERKGNGIGKEGVHGLSPSKKIHEAPTLQFITKLVIWFIDVKLLIEMGSLFRISLRLYLILLLQKIFNQT